jgi:hypothetical protein
MIIVTVADLKYYNICVTMLTKKKKIAMLALDLALLCMITTGKIMGRKDGGRQRAKILDSLTK